MNKYVPVIGLEIHVELKTTSKMFCQCAAHYFGRDPNTNTCPVCLGMPGALPVPNKTAVEWTIRIGQALNCTINKLTKFDRKHYFYPDLPKGYQISQYDEPIAEHGSLKIRVKREKRKDGEDEYEEKEFGIRRVHLEEDTAKLTHAGDDSLVDFNRSSVPLVEIVTEPDFDNPEDVKAFLEELHTIIRYLDVSDADMEKGSMRMEPNISLRKITNDELRMTNGEFKLPNYKVEVKNINSFNFAKKAIEYELRRQEEILEEGKTPAQETRGYNEDKGITYSQRSKEEAHDYRYFPEPDIPPMEFTDEYLEGIRKSIVELPSQKVARFVKDFGVKYVDAFTITRWKAMAQYYEKLVEKATAAKLEKPGQTIANLIVNKRLSTDLSVDEFIKKAAEMSKPKETDMGRLTAVIKSVISANEKSVADYKSGKTAAIMFLVGCVMREMKGQADAGVVKGELEKALK